MACKSVYLAEIPPAMADALIALIGQPFYDRLDMLTSFPAGPDAEEIDEPASEVDVSPTFREQLVKARRGQGVFRSSVLLAERACRVTGVFDPKHLRASHIKPWRDANNSERLSGSNGLLLSPHIDHLFDQGYISFSDDERLLVVSRIRGGLLDAWGIDAGAKIGTFNSEQRQFLEYHRINVFRHET
jgi:putative restriction endonuclease